MHSHKVFDGIPKHEHRKNQYMMSSASFDAPAGSQNVLRGGSRVHQLFVSICIAALTLQLMVALVQNGHHPSSLVRHLDQGWASPRRPSSASLPLLDLQYPYQMDGGRFYSPNDSLESRRMSVDLQSTMDDLDNEKVGEDQGKTAWVGSSIEATDMSELDLPDRLAFGQPKHSGRLRVLVGILTGDFPNDKAYRKRHRMLFNLWNDTRICSLPDFKSQPLDERYRCQFIYTFVMGASPNAPPELCDDSRPMEVMRPIHGDAEDLNEPDMTLLNIRENMNEGKSQTWMKYGAELAEEYDLDYVAKCDADSVFHIHEFFEFAYRQLPPAPYNKNVYVGALRDKAYWPRHKTEKELIRFEAYFGNTYEGVHLYVAGQIYIMSTDLARFVGQEALLNQCSYCEGHEDHDISAMAFHNPDPVKLVVIGRPHRFWEHPVKGEPRWNRIWAREQARVKQVPFEGKVFNNNSTFAAIMKTD